MTLRAQVDEFCKNATGLGKKIEKLEAEVKTLKEKLKGTQKAKPKAEPKAEPKKTRKVKTVVAERKLTEEMKGQRMREKAVTKELEKRKALGLPSL